MAPASFLKHLVPKITATTIEARLTRARQALAEAEARYRTAALEALAAGQDNSPTEDSADKALAKANQDIARLEAALVEAQAREGADAQAKRKATDAAADAKVAKAFDEWADAAKAIEPVLDAYARAYDVLVEKGGEARALALTNPRARQDILGQNVDVLVSLELARLSKKHLPPGADKWAATSRNPADLQPLADHFAGLASTVLSKR